jgi:glycosyltransferase involved in cell wall biosynthesis
MPTVVLVGQGPPATGGIPTYITSLLRSPAARRAAVLGFLNTTPSGERRPGSLTTGNLRRALRDAVRVFRAARRADVIHLNVAAVPLAPLARALLLCAAARAGGARTILHAHTGRLHIAAHRHAYRWLLRRSRLVVDAFVVVSRVEAEAARRAGIEPREVPNGIDADRFRTGPKADPPVIAFVGTVCERKGLLDLLGALARLRRDGAPPFRVEIVGDASQEGPGVFERVRDAYAREGLDGTVTFHGALAPNEVEEVLARASIFCLPSHWEGAPLSLLEAMAAETAPVASAVGEIPRMLDDGRAGVLVEPRDIAGLADGLRALLDGADRRSDLGREARRRAIGTYGEARSFELIADLHRRVAGYSM